MKKAFFYLFIVSIFSFTSNAFAEAYYVEEADLADAEYLYNAISQISYLAPCVQS